MNNVFGELCIYIVDAFRSIFPMFIVFLFFQIFRFKLPLERFWLIIKGIIIAYIGFTLFLYGINIGFINVGRLIGHTIASLNNNWILIPISFVLGFLITLAEPAVNVLINQVETITTGYINKKLFLYFLCVGVAVSTTLSMIRIFISIPLWYFLLPGYIIAFILIRKVSPLFVGLAFDSGGVVTGPMLATFMLALNVGCSEVIDINKVLINSFGMIGLVALVPILSVLILGILYEKNNYTRKRGN